MPNIYETQTTLQLILDKSSIASAFRGIAEGFVNSFRGEKLPTSIYSPQRMPPKISDITSKIAEGVSEIPAKASRSVQRAGEGYQLGVAGLPKGIYGPQGAAATMGNVAGRVVGGIQGTVAKGAEVTGKSTGFEALKVGAIMGTVVSLLKDGNDLLGGLFKMFRIMFQLLILPLILLLTPVIVPVLKEIAKYVKGFTTAMKTGDTTMAIANAAPLIGILFASAIAIALGSAAVTAAAALLGGVIAGGLAAALGTEIAVGATLTTLAFSTGASLGAWLIAVGGFIAAAGAIVGISVALVLVGLNIGAAIGQWLKDILPADVYNAVRRGILKALLFPFEPFLIAMKIIYPTTDIELIRIGLEEVVRHFANELLRTFSGGLAGLTTDESLKIATDRISKYMESIKPKKNPTWEEFLAPSTFDKLMTGKGTKLSTTLSDEIIAANKTCSKDILASYDLNILQPLSERLGKSQPTLGPLAKPTLFERGRDILALFGKGMMSFAEPLIGIVTSILNSIVQAFSNALASIVTIVNSMIAQANKASSAIGAAQKASPIQIPKKMAEGGIVTSPTLAMIGESGPEAVVPLGKGLSGDNIYITNHITVSPGADKGEMKKMFGEFAREQGRELRRRTSYVSGVYA
jgi:hypothetical protein